MVLKDSSDRKQSAGVATKSHNTVIIIVLLLLLLCLVAVIERHIRHASMHESLYIPSLGSVSHGTGKGATGGKSNEVDEADSRMDPFSRNSTDSHSEFFCCRIRFADKILEKTGGLSVNAIRLLTRLCGSAERTLERSNMPRSTWGIRPRASGRASELKWSHRKTI
jgi:hypothetical protein